jgi:DNA-binding transcriptional LysR family regulator
LNRRREAGIDRRNEGNEMASLPDFEAWAIFAKVAERGSFSVAAEELGLAPTTVSKVVTRLEERMGVTLFHRTTRKLSLTESGRAALDRAARIFSDGSAIEAEILEEAAVPRGLVKLASTGAFGVRTLAPLLPEFLKRYPLIELDYHITDGKLDMISDGFDAVIRMGPSPDSTMRVTKLFSHRVPVVAAPSFWDKHGRPTHPSELGKQPALVYSHIADAQDWTFRHAEHGDYRVHVEGPVRMNNGVAAIPALVAGLVMTAQPELYIWKELQEGLLEEVLGDWTIPAMPVHVITPPGRARPARVRVLLEFLREHFAHQPWARGIEH